MNPTSTSQPSTQASGLSFYSRIGPNNKCQRIKLALWKVRLAELVLLLMESLEFRFEEPECHG